MIHLPYRSLKAAKNKAPKPVVDHSAKVTDSNYYVGERPNPAHLIKKTKVKTIESNLNQMVFMRQIDQSLEQRSKTRLEREAIANSFRRWVKI